MDWFLTAHQVAPLQFEMGGLWAPISVRDQMVRGQELVRRAIAAGLVDLARPLIVIGAGAGGISAAIVAHDQGIPTIVIERDQQPFGRQAGITARSLFPYAYDWPLDRYRDPNLVAPATLPWTEGTADDAAAQWVAALGRRRLIAFGSSISPAPPTAGAPGPPIVIRGGLAHVHVTTPVGAGWLRGGMVLSSIGFGSETTRVPAAQNTTYEGWRFWENDAMAAPNLGAASPPEVVIAGGGDGALQDTIRALLIPAAHDLRGLMAMLGPVPDDVRVEIADVEDTATRAWLWATGGSDDCLILDTLQSRVEAAVHRWWSRSSVAISTALTGRWRSDVKRVTLVHSCTHFGRSYALNRFLVFLLERAAPVGRFRRTAGYHLASVDGGHACAPTRPCWGRHRTRFTGKTCGTIAPPMTNPPDADLIILRGGVAAPTSVLLGSPVANRRQHLPDRPR